jgi:putative transposase
MPRKPREEEAGAVVHVFARGNNRQRIFRDVEDRELYLALLGQVVRRQQWSCLAYCLMPNHIHLLVETPQPNLAAGIQRLHGLYAQTFNKRHGRCGHLFQDRYGGNRVKTDEQLVTTARYIALNPVEARLCAAPEEWAWSSHAATVGGGGAPAWLAVERLLGFFGLDGGEPRARYAEFVAGQMMRDSVVKSRTRSAAWAATSAPAALPASLANAALKASSSSK